VALAHCHACDTYYPRSKGGCRWCGTKAPSVSRTVLLVLAGVIAAAGIVAFGIWQYRSRTSTAVDERATTSSATSLHRRSPLSIPFAEAERRAVAPRPDGVWHAALG